MDVDLYVGVVVWGYVCRCVRRARAHVCVWACGYMCGVG